MQPSTSPNKVQNSGANPLGLLSAVEINDIITALLSKPEFSDLAAQIALNVINFDGAMFQGKNTPVPLQGDPVIGSAANPISIKSSYVGIGTNIEWSPTYALIDLTNSARRIIIVQADESNGGLITVYAHNVNALLRYANVVVIPISTTTTVATTSTTTTAAPPTTTTAAPVTTTTSAGPTTTTTTAAGPSIIRTFLLNFNTQWGASPANWNNLGPTALQVQTDNGYSFPNIINSTGGASSVGVNVRKHFAGTTASSPVNAGPANSGVYADQVMVSGWVWDALAADPTLEISGLDPTKFYDMNFLANGETYRNGLVRWTAVGLNTVTTTPDVLQNANNAPGTLMRAKNVQPTAGGLITITFHLASNVSTTSAIWNSLTIDETASAKP